MRPIALLSVMYKLCVKHVLAICKLSHPQDRWQYCTYGFRSGHQCAEVIHIMQHVVSRAQDEGIPVAVMKLDFAKAYDSVKVSELFRRLRDHTRLPFTCRRALGRLYAEASTVLSWQDVETQSVPITRGVRQGCPASPFVFACLMDGIGGYADWMSL